MSGLLRGVGAVLVILAGSISAWAAESTMLLANLDSLPLPSQPEASSRPPRTALARAYAVDGTSFYFEGRRVRVEGFDPRQPELATELARQKLQLALDAGEIELQPVGDDESGVKVARVLVQGRNVLDLLR